MTSWSRRLARSREKQKSLFSTTPVPMTAKTGRMVTYLKGLLVMKLYNALITCSCQVTWPKKTIISSQVPVATKLGRMVTYLDGLLPIKSHVSLTSWSYDMTWQSRLTISSLTQYLSKSNLVGRWLTVKGFHP